MSKRKRSVGTQKKSKQAFARQPTAIRPRYAEALAAAARSRWATVILPGLFEKDSPYPEAAIDARTQRKLLVAVATMALIGRSPGDVPVATFDSAIAYHRLNETSLRWLEDVGIPARRAWAPLATEDYIPLFADNRRLPVPIEKANRFFSHLTHCLLIEAQMIIAKQYYHGLGLYESSDVISRMQRTLPPEMLTRMEHADLSYLDFNQLHGRIFLEYCAIMIRAQWDKIVRLLCFVLGLEENWNSVSRGLRLLAATLREQVTWTAWCRDHLAVFVEIAEHRLADDGWLKRFRDPLLHAVGQHSAGVLPGAHSLETTSQMWEKVRDEHDWLREAMMAALVVLLSFRSLDASGTEPNPG